MIWTPYLYPRSRTRRLVRSPPLITTNVLKTIPVRRGERVTLGEAKGPGGSHSTLADLSRVVLAALESQGIDQPHNSQDPYLAHLLGW